MINPALLQYSYVLSLHLPKLSLLTVSPVAAVMVPVFYNQASESPLEFCAILTSVGWLKNPLLLQKYLPVFKHLIVARTGRNYKFILMYVNEY